MDEDTGEVVSIERNEIILDRDTILDKDNIEEIIEADVKKTILYIKRTTMRLITQLSTIRYKKTQQTLKKRLLNIFTDNYVTRNRLMRKQLVVL